MKELIISNEELANTYESCRIYIREKMIAAGFNMKKSFTVKCDKENATIIYSQKD
jgi:hypothetical protein